MFLWTMVEAVCYYLYHGHSILTFIYILLFLLTGGGTNDTQLSDNNLGNELPSLAPSIIPHSFASKVVQWNLHYCGYNRACAKYSPSVCYRCAPCRCDPMCHSYGDCCPDVIFLKSFRYPIKDNIIPAQDQECLGVNLPQKRLKNAHGKYTSENVEGRDPDRSITKRYYMVSGCPSDSNHDFGDCHNSEDMPPVTSISITPLVYKNIHCAHCHGIKRVLSWKLSIVCPVYDNSLPFSSHDAYPREFTQRGCDAIYTPPESSTSRRCYSEPNMISTCNYTGQWGTHDAFLQRACGGYLTPKVAEGKVYKNIFCYLCNKKDKSFDPTLDKCRDDPFQAATVFEATMDYDKTNTGDDPHTLLRSTGYEICGEHGLYDPEQKQCRHVTCAFGQRLDNFTDTCLPAFSDVKGLTYELYFKLMSVESIQFSGEYDYIHHLPSDMEKALREKLPGRHVKIEELSMSFNTTTKSGGCSDSIITDMVLYAKIKCIQLTNQSHLQQTLLSLRHDTFYIATHSRNITLNSFPIKIPWYLIEAFDQHHPHTFMHCVKIVSNNFAKIRQDGRIRVGTTTPDPAKVHAKLTSPPTLRVSKLLTCPFVQLLSSEYIILHGGQLKVPWRGMPLSDDSYFMDKDGSVSVCLSTFLIKLSQNSQRRTPLELMCTKVALAISILILLITFLVYLIFPILKSLPQKMYMIVIACLAFTQIAYLIGYCVPYYSDWCTAMGVIAHYFSLSLFIALTVSSYHLYNVFNTLHLYVDASRDSQTVIKYSCFILASPIVIVSTVIIIYISSNRGHSSIGYGSGALCFLTSPTAVWIAVFIPLVISTILSCILYLLTCSALKSNADLEIDLIDERYVHFYFRSCLFVAFIWTLGAIAIQLAIPEMRIAFVIAQCFFSLYLFITLVVNKRVAGVIAPSRCVETQTSRKDSTVLPLDDLKVEDTPNNRTPVIVKLYKQRDDLQSCGRSIGSDGLSIDYIGDEELTSRDIGDGYSTIETMA